MYVISKTLSANDTSETGAHQAGILIPKELDVLNFFPFLDKSKKNPRSHIMFEDKSGENWEFAFIYYNNKYFGGTRNEYRLTRMTKYIRSSNLVESDVVVFSKDNEKYYVDYNRKNSSRSSTGTLKLGSGWKIIQL